MAERCPMTFPAQVHPSCSWRALANMAPTGWHRSPPFPPAFQVVTFDHGGVGASEGEPPYAVEQWAADTLRLIDHLGLDRVHLVGHSTGGAIAQVLAADHSDRVASLVLGATWARLDARLRRLFMFRKRAL